MCFIASSFWGIVNNVLDKTRKNTAMVFLRHLPIISLVELQKPTEVSVRFADTSAKIKICDVPNGNQKY
jgi:hypothetical protein